MPPRSVAWAVVVFTLWAVPASAQDGLLEQARKNAAGMAPAAGSAAHGNALASPGRIWVFVVGLLEWRNKESYGSFPKKDRRDVRLVEHFKRELGVPEDHIAYFQDRKATKAAIVGGFGK